MKTAGLVKEVAAYWDMYEVKLQELLDIRAKVRTSFSSFGHMV